MARRSRIGRLPAELRGRIDRYLSEHDPTVDDFVAWLDELLAPHGVTVSRSAAHRHMQEMERVAARLRQSREVTEALVRELPEAAAQGKQGRLLVEMTRAIVFDLLVKLQDGGDEISTKDVQHLGKGLAELARALRTDQDFEERVRAVVARETAEAAAAAVERVASGAGLSADTIDKFRSGILGVVT